MITLDQLTDIIAKGEQLDVEFNSDRRTMPDREIYEEVGSPPRWVYYVKEDIT